MEPSEMKCTPKNQLRRRGLTNLSVVADHVLTQERKERLLRGGRGELLNEERIACVTYSLDLLACLHREMNGVLDMLRCIGLKFDVGEAGRDLVRLFPLFKDDMCTWFPDDYFDKKTRQKENAGRDVKLKCFLQKNGVLMSDRDNYLATKRREYLEKPQEKHTPEVE